jgi:LemA protein
MKRKTAIFSTIFIVVILCVIGLFIILNYNGFVEGEKRVEESKAQIAAVCQRRLDLLPNLIETVKGYAKHENETLTAVIQARQNAKAVLNGLNKNGSFSKDEMVALQDSQQKITSAFRGVFALIENYPNLRASSNFMVLQDQFEGTENRIAVARQRYNSDVKKYNAKIKKFPGVVLAPMFGVGEKDFFEVKQEAYEPVTVRF